MTRNQQIRWLVKPAVFLASVAPSAWLVWAALHGQLSANPLADLTNETGVWTLRCLSLTLCVTPVRRLAGWNDAIRFRRMLGLFAFYYGSLHLLTYVVADRLAGLEFEDGILAWTTARDLVVTVASDVVKRPFITIGFTAWLCLLPLAITSTAAMIRRLGGRRWQALHRLTYVAASVGVLHYWWLVKADVRRPLMWKYGFKHAKSIVRIRFVEKQPLNSWQQYAANEYGFYANVNPAVDHPRWSQATERRIGEFFRRKTLMFNGYGDQVQSLYAGMDLRRNY